MNTRGLMELIVVNVGYDMGLIPKNVFFMLVTMAILTTFMTPPILRRLIRNTALAEYLAVSDFALAGRAASGAGIQTGSRAGLG
jgi:Kef-type K+ transport system membrane component KefB